MENTKRIVWVDIIKIFAAFLIVMQHSISIEWIGRMPVNDMQWEVINLAFIVSRIGVPLFFMCSGYTMFRRKHSIREVFVRNLPGIIIPYISWMLVYGGIDAIGSSSVRIAIFSIVKTVIFGRYHTWFIATIIGLYLITPLLQEFIYDKKLLVYFLTLSFTFTVIAPYVRLIGDDRIVHTINDFNMNFVLGYVIYYLAGYFIGNLVFDKRIAILSFLCFSMTLCVCQVLCIKEVTDIGSQIQIFYSEFSIIGLILAVSLFVFLRCIANKDYSERAQLHIVKWAELGIGIYLLHPLLLPLISNLHGFNILAGTIAIYVSALLINLGISLTPLEKCFLKMKL